MKGAKSRTNAVNETRPVINGKEQFDGKTPVTVYKTAKLHRKCRLYKTMTLIGDRKLETEVH